MSTELAFRLEDFILTYNQEKKGVNLNLYPFFVFQLLPDFAVLTISDF